MQITIEKTVKMLELVREIDIIPEEETYEKQRVVINHGEKQVQ